MFLKNYKKVIVVLLVVAMSVSLFAGCKEKVEVKEGKLANQYVAGSYYCQQGYFEDWTISCNTSENDKVEDNISTSYGYYLRRYNQEALDDDPDRESKLLNIKCGLIAQFRPEGADNGKVTYSIYHHKVNTMTMTLKSTVEQLMNENHTWYFNERFTETADPREDFTVMSENYETTYSNKKELAYVQYKFTVDGTNYRGTYFVAMYGTEYFVVTFEAAEDVWDTYQAKFNEMLDDFRFVGMETEE